MTPLGEKLISLVKSDRVGSSVISVAPDIPLKNLNKLRGAVNCPAEDEVFGMDYDSFLGILTLGGLWTESGYYSFDSDKGYKYFTYVELLQMFNEQHICCEGFTCFGCSQEINKKTGKPEYALSFAGTFWPDFFDFYVQYSGAEIAEKATTGDVKVCEYCGKKFDASQDTCPGCGAPA